MIIFQNIFPKNPCGKKSGTKELVLALPAVLCYLWPLKSEA